MNPATNFGGHNPTLTAPNTHQIIDQQHGLPAATFTLPAGWQAQSQVQWNFQNHSMPVRLFARTADPRTGAMLEFFPGEGFFWIEPYLGFQQPGQESGGMYLLQPMSAADALTRWVVPKYRSNYPGVRIVAAEPTPQLARQLNISPTQAHTEGACVRVEYTENGTLIEEEFYGLKVAYPGIPSYGAAGTLIQYNWGFDRLISFRAPKGQLAAQRETFWSIVRSVHLNPAWEQVYAQTLQQLQRQFNQHLEAGYASINAATQMSRQISAQNDSWLAGQQQQRDAAYHSEQQRRQQSASFDYSNNDAFGDYVLGRETYNDPYYQYGSQHTGYHNHVWTDSQGNYQYSNDANFDPNIGASHNWVRMEKKQVGR